MAIKVGQAFERTSANPIDESLALTKAKMLTVNDNVMPAYYFTICQDDGKIYLYDKSATASITTGKFTEFAGGGGGDVKVFTTTAVLDEDINDTTTVVAADLPGVTWTDLKVGASIIKDSKGTLGLVTAINGTTDVTVTTATTSTPVKELTQSQYNALTPADKNNGTVYFVTDGQILPGATQTNYSTSEQVVGQWIDGKPIYQKTIVSTLPTCTTDNTIAIKSVDIGSPVGQIVSLDAYMDNGNGYIFQIICRTGFDNSGDVTHFVLCDATTNACPEQSKVRFGNARAIYSGLDCWATVRYTKTTD